MHPFELENINNTFTCYIYPRYPKFPNGLYLTYETCPETYDNETSKLIRYCCVNIMIYVIQDSLYKKTQDWLRYNSSSVLVGPAVLFNILSLIVLRRFQRIRSMSQNSTTFYMKSLCIFDTLTIFSKFLYEIIVVRNGWREEPLVITSFMCQFLSFSESFCAISSIYILIAMSFEKLVCVIVPLKVGLILTRFKAKIIFACIIFASAMISSYHFFDKMVVELESIDDTRQTRNTTHKKRITYDCDSKWPEKKNDLVLMNNIIRVFLPIMLLCICNSWIIIALSRARKNTEAMFTGNETLKRSSSENDRNRIYKNTEKVFRFKTTQKPKLSGDSVNDFQNFLKRQDLKQKKDLKNQKKSRNSTQHISIMLVTVSIGFVFFNLPFAIRTLFQRQFAEKYKIIDYLYHDENLFNTTTSKSEILSAIKFEFFASLTHLLLDLNYIMNFFLYFFSGSRFRHQLMCILRCQKPESNKPTFINSNYLKDGDRNMYYQANRKSSSVSYSFSNYNVKRAGSYSFDANQLKITGNTDSSSLLRVTDNTDLLSNRRRTSSYLS